MTKIRYKHTWVWKAQLASIFAGVVAFMAAISTSTAAETVTKEKVVAAIPRLEELANKAVANGEVPGLAIAVVYKDEVVYLGGFGVREVGKPDAVDVDTVFQLASLSQPISSTIVAALVSDGTVSWDSRISDLDPGFQLHDPYPAQQVTIRDLFAHRSGLSGNAGNDLEGLGFSRDEILPRLRHLKPTSSFRAGYAYSNFGLTEGAVAAAKPTGMAWEDVAEEKLYKPLGMSSTSSRYADFVKRVNRASLHVRVNGKWTPLVTRNPDPQSPAGGVSSNVRDLAQWVRLQLGNGKFEGKELVNEEAIAQTHVPLVERGKHAIYGVPSFYGLGWGITFGPYGTVWGHTGAFSEGTRTVASLIPSEQIGIVVLSNAFPTGMPDALADSFFDLDDRFHETYHTGGDVNVLLALCHGDIYRLLPYSAYDSNHGSGRLVFTRSVTRDWVSPWNALYASMVGPASEAAKLAYGTPPISSSPPLPLAAYAGTYRNEYVGTAVVVEDHAALMLKLGPGGIKSYPLKHFDRDLFIYFPYEEIPELLSGVTFQIGPDQKANQMTIENLNDDGQGVLRRVAGE